MDVFEFLLRPVHIAATELDWRWQFVQFSPADVNGPLVCFAKPIRYRITRNPVIHVFIDRFRLWVTLSVSSSK